MSEPLKPDRNYHGPGPMDPSQIEECLKQFEKKTLWTKLREVFNHDHGSGNPLEAVPVIIEHVKTLTINCLRHLRRKK